MRRAIAALFLAVALSGATSSWACGGDSLSGSTPSPAPPPVPAAEEAHIGVVAVVLYAVFAANVVVFVINLALNSEEFQEACHNAMFGNRK